MESEYQIQKTIISEHQLNVEGELFIEKKEHETWSKPESEDLHDMTRVSHSRQIQSLLISEQIGEDKFFKISQTFNTNGELIDTTEETNLETEEEVEEFKSAWESGWQPTLTHALPSDGFFGSLKKSLKFW